MMESTKTHRVIVYHDETKNVPGESESLRGHVLLFVPETLELYQGSPLFGPWQDRQRPCEIFMNLMQKIRKRLKCEERKFHFSDISGQKWSKYDQALFELVHLAVEAMRTKGVNPPLKQPLAFKLAVIFYPENVDLSLYGGDEKKEKRLRHDETILRILLKGAAHFLYSDKDRVEVLRIICDGQPEHRPFNEERILWQLLIEEETGRTPLRDYVLIHPEACIEHLSSDHKDHVLNSKEYVHANFLQVADILLGSVRHIFYGTYKNVSRVPELGDVCEDKRSVVAMPVWEMLKKVERGYGFMHSGHYRAFTISRMEFGSNYIAFNRLNLPNLHSEKDETMTSLF